MIGKVYAVKWRTRDNGFTLVELTVVILLIGLVLSLGLPRMAPALAFGKLEGSARHVSNYGRALMAHCALAREPVSFRIDLDTGEYWTARWIVEEDELFEEGKLFEGGEFNEKSRQKNRGVAPGSEDDAQMRAEEMDAQFQRFAKLTVEAQARNVPHEGILSEIGPLFEKKFDLEWDDKDATEEITTDFLARRKLPDDVRFELVRMGTTEYTQGRAEVNVSSTGLSEPVTFVLVSKDRRYTVVWDPITGSSRLSYGTNVDSAQTGGKGLL